MAGQQLSLRREFREELTGLSEVLVIIPSDGGTPIEVITTPELAWANVSLWLKVDPLVTIEWPFHRRCGECDDPCGSNDLCAYHHFGPGPEHDAYLEGV